MAVTANLMTVEQFRNLPEENGPVFHELRRGELVSLTRPKLKHTRIQKRLEQLLEAVASEAGTVVMEFPFRPVPEHELRVADVAYISSERWEEANPEDNLFGAPELVVEVLSPSNSAAEIYDKEKLCLENGAKEFWVIDPERRQVKVSTRDGVTRTWRSGQKIPLPLFGDAKIEVDSIFR